MISQGGGYRPLLLLLATMTIGVVIARPSEPSDSFGPVVGQFLKASSSVIVPETLRLEPGSLIGFSFRTCLPGDLLKQKGDGPDEIKLLLDEQGRLVLQILSASEVVEQAIVQTETKTKIKLNDGRWHTVILSVDEKTRFLTVSVSHDTNGGSAVLKRPAVHSLNLTASLPQLHVGGGTMACIQEGPGVHLSHNGLSSTAVQLLGLSSKDSGQICLLPDKCSDYNWSLLNEPSCNDNFCQNGGVCLPQSSGTAKCLCQPGFTGNNCDTKMSSCAENPCLNDANCTEDPSGGTGYRCECEGTNRRGRHCEKDMECGKGACENGGRIYQQPGSCLCECPVPYTGMKCTEMASSEFDPCLSLPCNNGTCHPRSSATEGELPFTCMCDEGFTGSKCEVDQCANQDCPTNSLCIKGFCHCNSGFTRTSAETCQEVNECAENPCQNGGTCINGIGNYNCNCRNGYTGLDCEKSIDYCKQFQCENGGVCYSIPETASAKCTCPTGFEGERCSQAVEKNRQISECLPDTCENGGSCIEGINGYSCTCSPGFNGPNCRLSDNGIDDNPCSPNPCQSDSICQKNATATSGYICKDLGCSSSSCPGPKTCGKASEDGVPKCQCRDFQIPRFIDEDCTRCSAQFNGTDCNECAEGYGGTGDTCEDVDECEESEICNNGICVNSPGSYDCFCRPGFGGQNCDYNFNECLSDPCQHGGTCTDEVNDFKCNCPPGYEGDTCEIDIDECASNPCQHDAECIQGIATFTCNCKPGYTGATCETNIDECEATPCQHNGKCEDGINKYICNCADTGYEGSTCEIDIDECESNPCTNNATCLNGIKDYTCECFPGYTGKNCNEDIYECEKTPCQNGDCFERSNVTLYEMVTILPENIRSQFDQDFSYEKAEGYVCSCKPGFEGDNCEVDINECVPDPCVQGQGKCKDEIAMYVCDCEPGYGHGEDDNTCSVEIDECKEFQPCVHGTCTDRVNDYLCTCENEDDKDIAWGGKNCSVELLGCRDKNICKNNGTCHAYLIDEINHKANCTCPEGFDGEWCQHSTTFSFSGGESNNSYIKVASDRPDEYELKLRFKTSLSDGLLAYGTSWSETEDFFYFSLGLIDGQISLNSNLISTQVNNLGSGLADTEWQSVYISIKGGSITLGVTRLQATEPISNTGSTAIYNTFIGGIDQNDTFGKKITKSLPSFTGCMEDITVNDVRITENSELENKSTVSTANTKVGCNRTDQCKPNQCQNNGDCMDLWNDFSCKCARPFLGSLCALNYTAGTFGYEDRENSIAIVNIDEPNYYTSGVDISMFIRTRKEDGFIFYFGSDLASGLPDSDSYITGELEKGKLVVQVFFKGNIKPERFQLYTVNVSDGNSHFIKVVRMGNSLMVNVGKNTSINHEIPSPTDFVAQKIYLGNYPKPVIHYPTTTVTTTTTTTTTTTPVTTTTTTPATTTQKVTAAPPMVTELIESTVSSASPAENAVLVEENDEVQPVIVKRARRQATTAPLETDVVVERPYFKGIIQDVQISNGKTGAGMVRRIVEFFKNDLDDTNGKPKDIGAVKLVEVEEGEKSDDSCKVDPCENGGTCSITWNDYECSCSEGWKGRNCLEKEFCHWNTCPEQSICQSLADGHECVSNATFNGVNSTLLAKPILTGNVENATDIQVRFRSRSSGTLLQVVGADNDQFIRLMLEENQIKIDLPETDGKMHEYFVDVDNNDGSWHTIRVRFENNGKVSSYLDGNYYADGSYVEGNHLTIDSAVDNLSEFVKKSSKVIVGSSLASSASQSANQNFYSVDSSAEQTTFATLDVIDVYPANYDSQYRGCMRELRIAGVLVPFFTPAQLVNNTASDRFDVETGSDVVETSVSGCVLCYEHECQNGAKCAEPQEKYECACQPGYEGETCDINIDECLDNKCTNGICVDGIANYTCNCNVGWTGWLCNEDLDECLAEPCKNKGRCLQTEEPGMYTCECTDQYRGHNCEQLKNRTCEDKPCREDAQCFDETNTINHEAYRCDCQGGLYDGVDCKEKRDFCKEAFDPCKNGASCKSIDDTLTYSCFCKPGYDGDNCETEINECEITKNPCNKGQCKDMLADYQCTCENTGFRGEFCETDIDECIEEQPCQNGGTCNNVKGGYECDCLTDFCGKNCTRRDICNDIPGICKNEGRCVPSCDESPFYYCDCNPEWEGRNCTIKSSRRAGDVALIVGPVVGGMLFIAVVGTLVFLIMARRKRRSEGKYKPASQELTSPRLQLDNLIKPPPEERLI